MSISKKKLRKYMNLLIGGADEAVRISTVTKTTVFVHEGLSHIAAAVGAKVKTRDRECLIYPYESYFYYAGRRWEQIGKTLEESRE